MWNLSYQIGAVAKTHKRPFYAVAWILVVIAGAWGVAQYDPASQASTMVPSFQMESIPLHDQAGTLIETATTQGLHGQVDTGLLAFEYLALDDEQFIVESYEANGKTLFNGIKFQAKISNGMEISPSLYEGRHLVVGDEENYTVIAYSARNAGIGYFSKTASSLTFDLAPGTTVVGVDAQSHELLPGDAISIQHDDGQTYYLETIHAVVTVQIVNEQIVVDTSAGAAFIGYLGGYPLTNAAMSEDFAPYDRYRNSGQA